MPPPAPPRMGQVWEDGASEISSPPGASGDLHEVLRRRIYERLVEGGNLEAASGAGAPSFRDKLDIHFDKLPRRYLSDLGVAKAEDVMLHSRILDQCAKEENRPVFHARFLEVAGAMYNNQAIKPSIVQKDRSVSGTTEVTVCGSVLFTLKIQCITVQADHDDTNPDPCRRLLEDLTLERRKGAENTGSMSASSRDLEHTLLHEIIFSSIDKPKLLSQLTSVLSEVGLNIREAHVYSTTDGFCLDVFVVDGWKTEGTEELLTKIKDTLIQKNASPPNSINSSSSGKILELRQQVGDSEIDWSMLTKGEMIVSGSSSDLYRGTYNGFDVAIKLLRTAHLNSSSEVEFLQEILILRSVNHENILKFYGACTRHPNCCIVTEYMPEGNLYDFLHKQNDVLEFLLILRIAISISKGMEYLHQNNIIHRDLKTANVLMGHNQVVKIADFGVARLGSQEGQMTAETGTYRWMAPEIINHKPYDYKADVFSFAIILWELITLKVPYDNMTPLQAALGVRQGLRMDIPPSVHPRLSELIQQCWDEDPDVRPVFAEISERLEGILQHVQAPKGGVRRSRAKMQKKSQP